MAMRSHYCGLVTEELLGQSVSLCGWVHRRRDHGGVIFIDLRDRTGIVQLRCEPSPHAEAHRVADTVRSEWVVAARGQVISRGTNVNPKIPTGEVEIAVEQIEVLSEAATPPFEVKDGIDTGENTRLTYRYLDLRPVVERLAAHFGLQVTHIEHQWPIQQLKAETSPGV